MGWLVLIGLALLLLLQIAAWGHWTARRHTAFPEARAPHRASGCETSPREGF